MPPLNGEWKAEINRRSDEYEAGAIESVPWEQIKTDALSRQSTMAQ
jgi:putative addiction module component (TIGR02574 family)